MFHIFLQYFLLQFYAPGTSVIMVLHYYLIVFNFCQMNSVFGAHFLRFCFLESYFLVFLSVAKYFLGSSEIPNSVDLCL